MIESPDKDKQKLETYIQWQKVAEEKTSRILVLILIITTLYAYYALLSPLISNRRIDKIRVAKGDLVHIISQFENLSKIYYQFVVLPPKEVTQHMGIFQDQIIPTVKSEIRKVNSDQKNEQLQLLNELAENMKTLTDLYNIYFNQHPRSFPNQIESIASLGADEKTVNQVQHVLVEQKYAENDAIFELDLLIRIEESIQNLIKFSTKTEDFTFSDISREAYSRKVEPERIRMMNNFTETFRPFRLLSKSYTEINSKLKFLPDKGISSYKDINDLIAPPFEVKTINDLMKLQSITEITYEKEVREYEQKSIEIPLIKVSFDKTILILIFPVLVLILLHLMNSYLSRYLALIDKIDKLSSFSKQEYLLYAPHFYPILNSTVGKRSIFIAIMRISIKIAPILVLFVYFYYVLSHSSEYVIPSLQMVFGLIISIFVIIEVVFLNCQLPSSIFSLKIKSI